VPLPDISRLGRSPGAALSRRFQEIGLTRDAVRALTERGDDLRSPLVPTREALYSGEAPAIGVRLFFCREPVDRAEAADCLGSGLLDAALGAGVLAAAGADRFVAPFHLRTVLGLYLFSDYLGSHPDAVMGAGETTAILYQAGRPERPVGRVLDLGCGAGTLALLLAGHAREVVGTDINARAIALAAFNASINGIGNVDFRCGDLFAPVEGERFDLAVSQPPYYPAPAGASQTFLHGGPVGDELALRVAAGIPARLAPGGRGVLFTSWPEGRGPLAGDAARLLELYTERREVHGTRQCIDVIENAEPGSGWSARFAVPADSWGFVTSRRIDRLIAAEELLRAGTEMLLAARLRLPEGTEAFREESQAILHGPPDSLIGFTPLDDAAWEAIAAVNAAPDVRSGLDALPEGEAALAAVEAALRRGLLEVRRDA
jgi:SAM-dependent methyltransferase